MKIAIIKLSALGDIVHSMVALEFIKAKYPNIHIDWVVEEMFSGVLENNPNIDNIITVNLKSLKKNRLEIFSQIKKIKKFATNNYDLVIDAQGLIKSAIVAKLIGKKIAGFDSKSIRESLASLFYTKDKKVHISYNENTIDRNAKVLSEPLGFSIDKDEILAKKPFLHFKNEDNLVDKLIKRDRKNIIFIIGATWKSRVYPKEKVAKIADDLKENSIIVWGNEEEKGRALWIEKNSSYAKAIPKKLDLNSLKALISKSSLLVGNDTGPTHMAWGLNIPSITIFGPTPVNRIYETKINKIVKSSSKVDHFKLNKDDFSINEIDENEILHVANRLLENKKD